MPIPAFNGIVNADNTVNADNLKAVGAYLQAMFGSLPDMNEAANAGFTGLPVQLSPGGLVPAHVIDFMGATLKGAGPSVVVHSTAGETIVDEAKAIEWMGCVVLLTAGSAVTIRRRGAAVTGTLSGVSSDSVSFGGTLSASDGAYSRWTVRMTSGAAAGQERPLVGYTGSTRTGRLAYPFANQPLAGDSYRLGVPRGWWVEFVRVGAGTINFAADGGLTLRGTGGATSAQIPAQYKAARMTQREDAAGSFTSVCLDGHVT